MDSLPDPFGFMGRTLAGDVCTRADMYGTACTVLLGEPGLGKSTSMEQRRLGLPSGTLFFDLRWISAEEVLEGVRQCISNAPAPHIVIDSVDEAMANARRRNPNPHLPPPRFDHPPFDQLQRPR